MTDEGQLKIGWAEADITPEESVIICGQFHARVSEGVRDPLTATCLVLDTGEDHAVMVSCDLVAIGHPLRDAVREKARAACDGLDPMKIVLNATHTHDGPDTRAPAPTESSVPAGPGVDLPAMKAEAYIAFASERVASAVKDAWDGRAPGTMAYGLGHAVVGRNRRWVDAAGVSTMYGNTDSPSFSHVEGYEDHSLNVLACRDGSGTLTGVIVNIVCPSQETENLFELSADFWHETRTLLRERLGAEIHVLPQCSAAGDQSPHPIYERAAAERMLKLKGRTSREEIAHRIADGVCDVLACLENEFVPEAVLKHEVATIELPVNALTAEDAAQAEAEAAKHGARYEEEKQKLAADPKLKDDPRWYVPVTREYRRMGWYRKVAERFKEGSEATLGTEVHILRLGDVAFATNRFEYYLDYGIFIKVQSKANQTFLVQLAGPGTYVPSPRSVQGGGYGSVPASNRIGPEGGRILAEKTVAMINAMWEG